MARQRANQTQQEPLTEAAAQTVLAEETVIEAQEAQQAQEDAQKLQEQQTEKAMLATSAAPIQSPSTVFVAMNYPHNVKFTVPDRDGMMCEIELQGNATELRGKKMGILPVGAYGITEIDAGAWGYIKAKYAGLPLIRSGLIFATERSERYAQAAAAERKDVRNGYEPVDPKKVTTKPADKTDV